MLFFVISRLKTFLSLKYQMMGGIAELSNKIAQMADNFIEKLCDIVKNIADELEKEIINEKTTIRTSI